MKILVCISNVPDTTTKISFKDDDTKLNDAGVQFVINPSDEFALTRAIELKEQLGGTVTVINVGLVNTDPIIRKALAIGADDAIRVNSEPADAFYVASQIANNAQGFDMILTGKESIDFNGGQLAGMVGELLGIPSVSVAVKLDVDGDSVVLEREIDGGKEVVVTPMPFIAACQKPMAEPRIPNMRGIMSARTKPLSVVEPVEADQLTNVERFMPPAAKGGCRMIPADQAEQLIDILKNEVKAI